MVDTKPHKITVKVKYEGDPRWGVYPPNILELNEWCFEAFGPKGLCWNLVFQWGYNISVYEFENESDHMLFRLTHGR